MQYICKYADFDNEFKDPHENDPFVLEANTYAEADALVLATLNESCYEFEYDIIPVDDDDLQEEADDTEFILKDGEIIRR